MQRCLQHICKVVAIYHLTLCRWRSFRPPLGRRLSERRLFPASIVGEHCIQYHVSDVHIISSGRACESSVDWCLPTSLAVATLLTFAGAAVAVTMAHHRCSLFQDPVCSASDHWLEQHRTVSDWKTNQTILQGNSTQGDDIAAEMHHWGFRHVGLVLGSAMSICVLGICTAPALFRARVLCCKYNEVH